MTKSEGQEATASVGPGKLDKYLQSQIRFWTSIARASQMQFDDSRAGMDEVLMDLCRRRHEGLSALLSLFEEGHLSFIEESVFEMTGASVTVEQIFDPEALSGLFEGGKRRKRGAGAGSSDPAWLILLVLRAARIVIASQSTYVINLLDASKRFTCEEISKMDYVMWHSYLHEMRRRGELGHFSKTIACGSCLHLKWLGWEYGGDLSGALPAGATWLEAFVLEAKRQECGLQPEFAPFQAASSSESSRCWVGAVRLVVRTSLRRYAGTDDLVQATILRDGSSMATLNLDYKGIDDNERGDERAYDFHPLPRRNDQTPELPPGIGQTPPPYPLDGIEFSNGLGDHLAIEMSIDGSDMWIKDRVQLFVKCHRLILSSGDLRWTLDEDWEFIASWDQDVALSRDSSEGVSTWMLALQS